jgi:transcription initiation factor TFIIIB Brf1 subunit/transcription initiation factor TFIIB
MSELQQYVCKVDGLYEKDLSQAWILYASVLLNIRISQQRFVEVSNRGL